MKATKKFVAGALATAMALAVNVPAFAATITINNPVEGQTYTAYKLFDVTHGAGADGKMGTDDDTYSYSTSNQTIANTLGSAELGLTFTKAANEDVWYVSGLEDAAALAAYIDGNDSIKSQLGDGITATEKDGALQVTTDEAGYYFVDSSLGSLCALNTVTDTATVNEKNSVPSIDKKVWEDASSEYVDGKAGVEGDNGYATIDVTDTVKYELLVSTGSNSYGTGTGIDANFVITDKLPDGITFKADSVAITGWTKDTDYTVAYDEGENTLTITLLSTGKLGTLSQNANITITYEATAANTLSTYQNHTNEVTLAYNGVTSTDTANVKTFKIGQTSEGTPAFTKVDGSDNSVKLQGVKFILQNNTTKKYATFNNNNLSGWVEDAKNATALVTDENGNIIANGLDADTYTLTETETLPGYNLLDGTISVVIGEDGKVTYDLTSDEDEAGESIIVKNNAGTLLPSTGGMGTTVLYIAGIVLVLGAGVTLVVRRRMNQDR